MLLLKNLKASVKEKAILNGLNLEIKPGEVHAIMGPNGSGKSTLSSVIAGREEYEIEEGSIDFNEINIMELSPEERSQKGVFLSFQYLTSIVLSNIIREPPLELSSVLFSEGST